MNRDTIDEFMMLNAREVALRSRVLDTLDQYGQPYRWCSPNQKNRTKEEYPYGYSDHFLWGTPAEGDSAVYTDRLSQWDHDAFSRACRKSSKSFRQYSKADADVFITEYYGRPTSVSALSEGCNVSNGYPYWVFSFHHLDAAPTPEPTEAPKE
jgi:hypothetical protein